MEASYHKKQGLIIVDNPTEELCKEMKRLRIPNAVHSSFTIIQMRSSSGSRNQKVSDLLYSFGIKSDL